MALQQDGISTRGEITSWLEVWPSGDVEARNRLIEHLYPQLRRLVGHHLNGRRQITLQTTELINELYLQLVGQQRARWQDRTHFFAIAGRLLRRVVVDHERHRRRGKRGGGRPDGAIEEVMAVAASSNRNLVDVLTLDAALVELQVIDERAAQIVELRFFAGCSHDEVAAALGIGRATVARSWRFARAWLRKRLEAATASATR